MRADADIQSDIREELGWDARLKGLNIEVGLLNGHVSLTGPVDSYPKKLYAEETVRRVSGVKSVDNQLLVKIPPESKRTDAQIKKAVFNAIKWCGSLQEDRIKVEVKNGSVVLEGNVDWQYQRAKARHLAEDITGVKEVTNLIKVVSAHVTAQDVEERIRIALKRNYYLNTGRIRVEVNNNEVLLSGQVRTLAEKHAAETAAWFAPGISNVVNELLVDHSEVFA